jgi:carbon monoxide dehydrogenase subunit G
MKMNGEQMIAAPRDRVWAALNDPEVLKQCIPGCQSLEKEADDRLKATVAIKIGPIGAKFAGAVTLSELDPPNSYVISGEGQGGNAGFARGGARVSLADEGEGTRLTYSVDAEVGGRLAQVGGPIVDATAKQLAGTFFKKFGAIVSAESKAPAATSAAIPDAAPASAAAAPTASTSRSPAPVAATAFATPVTPAAGSSLLPWTGGIFFAALGGYLYGGGSGLAEPWQSAVAGIAIAAVAAFGYACGRTAGPVVVTIDPATARLLADRTSSPT